MDIDFYNENKEEIDEIVKTFPKNMTMIEKFQFVSEIEEEIKEANSYVKTIIEEIKKFVDFDGEDIDFTIDTKESEEHILKLIGTAFEIFDEENS